MCGCAQKKFFVQNRQLIYPQNKTMNVRSTNVNNLNKKNFNAINFRRNNMYTQFNRRLH